VSGGLLEGPPPWSPARPRRPFGSRRLQGPAPQTLKAWPPSRSPVRDKPSPAYRRARGGVSGIEIGAGWCGGGRAEPRICRPGPGPSRHRPARLQGQTWPRGRPGRRRCLRPDLEPSRP